MRMSRARDSGERDHRNSLSVSGLPTRRYSAAAIPPRRTPPRPRASQAGGIAPPACCGAGRPPTPPANKPPAGAPPPPPAPPPPAMGPAVDRDLGRVGPALIDRVLDRVQQVV